MCKLIGDALKLDSTTSEAEHVPTTVRCHLATREGCIATVHVTVELSSQVGYIYVFASECRLFTKMPGQLY